MPTGEKTFKRGDHVCAVYTTPAELAREAAGFLVAGIRSRERCWYIGEARDMEPLRAALARAGIDVAAETRRGALLLLPSDAAYGPQGRFEPEATMRVFNDAIEQAYTDGFSGFRAAAEMSWALDCEDGGHQVIVYEALLKSLFMTCGAIGMCFYDRTRMPLAVLNGALVTHPIAGPAGYYGENPFYDPAATDMPAVRDSEVLERLDRLAESRSDA